MSQMRLGVLVSEYTPPAHEGIAAAASKEALDRPIGKKLYRYRPQLPRTLTSLASGSSRNCRSGRGSDRSRTLLDGLLYGSRFGGSLGGTAVDVSEGEFFRTTTGCSDL